MHKQVPKPSYLHKQRSTANKVRKKIRHDISFNGFFENENIR